MRVAVYSNSGSPNLVTMTIKNFLRIIIVAMAASAVTFFVTPKASSLEEEVTITHEHKSIEVINTRALPIREYAEYHVDLEFGKGQFEYFDKIIMKESSWRVTGPHYKDSKVRIKSPDSVNLPDSWIHQDEKGYYYISTATGLGGFLDATWGEVGCVKTEDMYTQVDCTMKYIEKRYGTPKEAYRIHQIKNSY